MSFARVATMLRPAARLARPATARAAPVRAFSAGAGSLPEDMIKREQEAHAAWLKNTESYPIYEPDFYWTLEFALPPLMELHQFGESPVIVDVQNRDPDADPDDHH